MENFKKRHWQECSIIVNEGKNTIDRQWKTGDQCKSKWKSLLRRYVTERGAENQTGGVKSSWDLFSRIDHIVGSNPKIIGIPGGKDTGQSSTMKLKK